MPKVLNWLCACLALWLFTAAPLHAAVVVSSKLSSESVMIGQMIRLLLNAYGFCAGGWFCEGGALWCGCSWVWTFSC